VFMQSFYVHISRKRKKRVKLFSRLVEGRLRTVQFFRNQNKVKFFHWLKKSTKHKNIIFTKIERNHFKNENGSDINWFLACSLLFNNFKSKIVLWRDKVLDNQFNYIYTQNMKEKTDCAQPPSTNLASSVPKKTRRLLFFCFDYAKNDYLIFNFKLFHFLGYSTPIFTLIFILFVKLKFELNRLSIQK